MPPQTDPDQDQLDPFADLEPIGSVNYPVDPSPNFTDLSQIIGADIPLPGPHSNPTERPAKPHHADLNYQAMVEVRDILLQIARKPSQDRLKVDSALGVARIATEMINLFGIDLPVENDVGGVAAIAAAAGAEAARRATNMNTFGTQTPAQGRPWATIPGDPNPRRQ